MGLLQLDTDRNVVHHNARLSQILESAPEGTARRELCDIDLGAARRGGINHLA